jgi:hypothetical protein
MISIMVSWMQQIEFHPALFALIGFPFLVISLHPFTWSEEMHVFGHDLVLSRNVFITAT